MGLRIATNIASQTVQKNLKEVSEKNNSTMDQLSSGRRITKAADDAAGLGISTNLEAQTKSLRQAARNASDGISLVQTAEGGLNESTNILTRLRELSVQAASDTLGDNERGFLDKEYQQLVVEMDRIAQSTTFNGTKLLAGDVGNGNLDFHVGAYAGEQNIISYNADSADATSEAIGVAGSNVAAKDSAKDAMAIIDEGINRIVNLRSEMGAVQSRLQSTVSNIEVQAINQDAARSKIQDVDVAEASAKLASTSLVKHSAISTLAQANSIPSAAMKLVG
ncbi:MAG: flagellin [Bdellovibrionales bacterium RIFOXYB1_FULL_37_110]|nr:MAG: flagellin [Bdellovibrionales bacterium RIFOXYA1_FULL_38_20]OFZ47350.1 MAG: flagellin [Bdellovibrionales bacterium RIFOXYC1_FULL_37_79]OFZ58519.1 MAG: flagellin [Bdellovibrionales bacterium RIFOXYB1_FULL_37_110]OFZ63567.1 MAG: flagellin [Bdellovibrionales bacterium RIFOXYD1_FULL_36_51]